MNRGSNIAWQTKSTANNNSLLSRFVNICSFIVHIVRFAYISRKENRENERLKLYPSYAPENSYIGWWKSYYALDYETLALKDVKFTDSVRYDLTSSKWSNQMIERHRRNRSCTDEIVRVPILIRSSNISTIATGDHWIQLSIASSTL